MLPASLNMAMAPTAPFSPLMLADRLITLAQEADRAGYSTSATKLIGAAFAVLDEEAAGARAQ